MIRFEHVPPEDIDALPADALRYLENAVRRTPNNKYNLSQKLLVARNGFGGVFLIFDDETLIGCTFIITYDMDDGKVISPVLLGGKDFRRWKTEYWDFVYALGMDARAVYARFSSRAGWARMYPACKKQGNIYEYKFPRFGG